MCDVITRVYGRFVCHVISITYQTIEEGVLQELLGLVDENSIKVKLLTNSTFDVVEPRPFLASVLQIRTKQFRIFFFS